MVKIIVVYLSQRGRNNFFVFYTVPYNDKDRSHGFVSYFLADKWTGASFLILMAKRAGNKQTIFTLKKLAHNFHEYLSHPLYP